MHLQVCCLIRLLAGLSFAFVLVSAVGHWLGLDTHDSSTMSHDRQMEPGVSRSAA